MECTNGGMYICVFGECGLDRVSLMSDERQCDEVGGISGADHLLLLSPTLRNFPKFTCQLFKLFTPSIIRDRQNKNAFLLAPYTVKGFGDIILAEQHKQPSSHTYHSKPLP